MKAQPMATRRSAADKIFSFANVMYQPSEFSITQEFHDEGGHSVRRNHDKPIRPATNPRPYPERGLKKTRKEAHRKATALASAAISPGRSQMDRPWAKGSPVRSAYAMLAAAHRKSIAAVSLGVSVECASQKVPILMLDTGNARQFPPLESAQARRGQERRDKSAPQKPIRRGGLPPGLPRPRGGRAGNWPGPPRRADRQTRRCMSVDRPA